MSARNQPMSVQDLYDRVKRSGSDPANVKLVLGYGRDTDRLPIALNERLIRNIVGTGKSQILFVVDDLL